MTSILLILGFFGALSALCWIAETVAGRIADRRAFKNRYGAAIAEAHRYIFYR